MDTNVVVSGSPSPHVLSLAGVDLPGLPPPQLRVEEAKEVAVVLSRSRDPHVDVHLERCRGDGVPVVVRPSGGGSVVLMPGVVTASCLRQARGDERFPEPVFRRFSASVCRALAAVGLPGLHQRGVSDLCLDDRKVAGSSLRMWRGRVLYQVSVLVAPRLELMDRYLPMPSRAPDYRVGRPHGAFLTSLEREGCSVGPATVVGALRLELERELASG